MIIPTAYANTPFLCELRTQSYGPYKKGDRFTLTLREIAAQSTGEDSSFAIVLNGFTRAQFLDTFLDPSYGWARGFFSHYPFVAL